jgi:flagellin
MLRINTNIASLRTQTQMLRTSKALQRALERLSSGQRVNSARDDASGLARSVGLDSQVRGFNRAILNMNEAQGMLMTAEGAMQTQMDLIQRMRELAVQAANGTLTSSDRANLDQELQSLMAEFNRLTKDTNFNGQSLLDGSFGTQKVQVGTEKNQTINLSIDSTNPSDIFTKDVGSGAFAPATTLNTSGAVLSNELADLNGDGHLDLIVSAFGGNIEVHDGNGDGTFKEARLFNPGIGDLIGEMKLGDITGDGKLDIVSFLYSDFVVIAGQGDGTFGAVKTYTGSDLTDLELADFNNDGRLDIVTVNGDNDNVIAYLNDGDGTFTDIGVVDPGFGNSELIVGDFNNDGHQDIFLGGNSGGEIGKYYGNGSGTFTFSSSFDGLSTAGTFGLASADMDNDGDLDLVSVDIYTSNSQVRVALNNGAGVFTVSATTYSVGSFTRDIEVMDLNDDGRMDIVTLNSSSLSILLGTGSGNFTFGTTRSINLDGMDLAMGDLNGDGALDLAAGDFDTGSGNSNGIFLALLKEVQADHEVTITTMQQAQKLLGILDNAIQNISERRSSIGALQNRLDYAQSVTSLSRENLASARSQILDADLAEETAELTRLQILQQAQASVLAQSNVSLRIALQLLSS